MPITWLNHEFVVQYVNGQCIIVLSSKLHDSQQRADEVFVKGIPSNFGPNELIPIFSQAGLIHTIRLLMDYGQYNRGFAYVSYVDPRNIQRAYRKFNGMNIAVNHKLELSKCRDSRTIYIYNISDFFTDHTMTQTITHLVHVNRLECKVFRNADCFVAMLTFPSHRDFVQASNKIKRMRHIFGPAVWIKHDQSYYEHY